MDKCNEITATCQIALDNALSILQNMKSSQALYNYKNIAAMKKFILKQENAIEELLDLCNKAADTIKNYRKLTGVAQDFVGETAWQEILSKAYKS